MEAHMTSLDRLTIRGFKSIKNLEDFELGNLNVFIGGNGAGKTNLISFFKMMRVLVDGDLNDFIIKSGGIGDILFNGRKTTKEMFFETHFGPRAYKFTLQPTLNDTALISDEARYFKHGSTGWWALNPVVNGTSALVDEAMKPDQGSNKHSVPVYEAIASWQIYHFHDTGETAGMRHREIIEDNQYLRSDGSNIASVLLKFRKKSPYEYKEILQAIRLVMPFFDDFYLTKETFGPKEKVGLSWKQKGSDFPMQPYHLSDGSIRFICLAAALLQPEPPSTIIIDEPELGLHPAAVSILAELIEDASKRTQVIIATQSPSLIDYFSVEDIITVNRKEGASSFNRPNKQELDKWLEDYSVGELWVKNVLSGGPVYE